MKKFTTALFILFYSGIFFSKVLAAPTPPKYRFEFSAGAGKLKYHERRNFGLIEPTKQSQSGKSFHFNWQYFFFPPYLDFEVEVNYLDGSQSNDYASGEVKLLQANYKLGYTLPMIADKFSLGIAADLFQIENLTPHEQFSMQRQFIGRFYPTFVWFPTGFETDINFSFYIRRPLFQVALDSKEFSAGLVFYFPLGGKKGLRYPLYSYQNLITLRIDYTDLTLKFDRPDEGRINIYEIEQLTVRLGFNF